jgi:transposase
MIINITDEKWKYFQQFFCKTSNKGRPRSWDDRLVLEAILYVLSNGLKWESLPEKYPPKSTVYSRFRLWCDTGAFIALRDTLLEIFYENKSTLETCFIDGTFVRSVCGGDQIGLTKMGKGSKIMALVDDKSVPVAAIATSAQPHEISLVLDTLNDCPILEKIKSIVGDKAYDSDSHDEALRAKGINLIAPHKKNRKRPKTQDGRSLRKYSKRWVVERFFAWMKPARRLLVRFDKKISVFQAFLDLFSALVLFRRCYK